MVIAIDVGNSSISVGYFSEKGLAAQKIGTEPLRSPDEYSEIVREFLITANLPVADAGVIISSVVNGYGEILGESFRKIIAGRSEIVMVDYRMKTGLQFKTENPMEIGTDRIANAAGAYELYKTAVAVLDFGTATTVTVVDADAGFLGGAILPGLKLMNESLDRGTSRLSRVDVDPPATALGRNTRNSIQSGLFYGTAGAAEKLIYEIEVELGIGLKAIVTGGFGPAISPFISRPHELVPSLTLEGLRILYEKNRPSGAR